MQSEIIEREIKEIKDKLSEIRSDMRRFIEQSVEIHVESIISGIMRDFSNAILGHLVEDIEEGLDENMVKKCPMKEKCKSIFTDFLLENAGLIKNKEVEEDIISKGRSDLEKRRKNAPFNRCEKCFTTVSDLFERQIRLIHMLRVYRTEGEKQNLSAFQDDSEIVEILDAVSNKYRFKILRSLSIESKSFSQLSELTGLRGGNLLFHLQKLLERGIIMQLHGRGNYVITEKGYKILKSLVSLTAE